MWPFRRREEVPGTPAALPVRRGDWRSAPPIRRVVPDHPLVNPVERFSGSLTSWRSPAHLAPLGHRVDVDEPSGVVEGVVQRVVEPPTGEGRARAAESGAPLVGARTHPVPHPVPHPAPRPLPQPTPVDGAHPAEPLAEPLSPIPAPAPTAPSTPRRGLGLPITARGDTGGTDPPPVQRIEFGPPPRASGPPPPEVGPPRVARRDTGPPDPIGAANPVEPGATPSRRTGPPAPSPEELLDKLYDPLVRRLKAELWLDRERRGSLTDRWR
ncbi:hypothetical protein [Saccharothrix xinjiangensis]|uniref:Uncharacterized protein n=1 Tax=Saccharothrix xinjiangensis TaxID=204798 RepID=A0ABV9YDX2_9PSEU